MIKVEITDSKNGAIISGDVDVILANELFADGRYTGPEPVRVNASGVAVFYKDRPEEEYDGTVTFIVLEQQFRQELKGKRPVIQIEIKLNK
jgi:hypothetical protein